jgi:hypothetical protein
MITLPLPPICLTIHSAQPLPRSYWLILTLMAEGAVTPLSKLTTRMPRDVA